MVVHGGLVQHCMQRQSLLSMLRDRKVFLTDDLYRNEATWSCMAALSSTVCDARRCLACQAVGKLNTAL